MAIPVFDKFKSVTAEGKLLDYDEIADVPIERRDLATNPPTEAGYYQHTGSKGRGFLPEVIYYFFKANETDTRLSYASLDPQDYANVQMLEDGRYDLSAYGFVDDKALENYVPKTSTGDIYITSNADLRLDASGGNGTTRINMDGVDSYIGITASDIRLIGDDNIGITFTQRNINISGENVYLSGYVYANNKKVSTEEYVQSYVSSFEQALTEARVDLSAYGFATETYVANAVSDLVDSSPETLNTLYELAAALGNDPNFATTMATELGKKQATITGAATTITSSNLTASRALVSDANGKVAVSAVTSTELGYLDGVTSAIQTQLNGTVKLAGAQTITGDKTTTGLFKIQNGAASGAFVLGADVNAKTLTANVRKLGRMGVPSYDSTTKTMAGISFDSQQYANYADFGGHPNNAASIAPDVIRFVVANKHDNTIAGARKLALQISNQAGLVDTAGGGTSVVGAKFFVPVIVDGNLSATSLTENGTALSNKYLGKTAKASSATVADSANSVEWENVTGKPSSYYTLPTAGKDTLGGVKTTSTVTSASGYTACPIIGGVPYYKDTDGQLRQYYTHANMDVELPIIYSNNTTVSGTGNYKTTYGGVKAGFTFNPYTDTLSVGNIQVTGENFYMGALSIGKGDNWVDFMLNGGDAGLYMSYDEEGNSYVDIYGDKVTLNGFQPGGSGGGGSSGGSNVIRTDWEFGIESQQDICFLIPDYDTNENDFVGEVELWINNSDNEEGELSLFEGITGENQLNSDNTIWIPDDCVTMYIKFSFVDNYILVQGNDTHGMSYTCGFVLPIEKPSGRLFSISIQSANSGRYAIIGRTVEYL